MVSVDLPELVRLSLYILRLFTLRSFSSAQSSSVPSSNQPSSSIQNTKTLESNYQQLSDSRNLTTPPKPQHSKPTSKNVSSHNRIPSNLHLPISAVRGLYYPVRSILCYRTLSLPRYRHLRRILLGCLHPLYCMVHRLLPCHSGWEIDAGSNQLYVFQRCRGFYAGHGHVTTMLEWGWRSSY
jgi:hypothetical protein